MIKFGEIKQKTMEVGKKICETLKGVRKKIAEANGIEYEPTECRHTGDCLGTCPKCESELRYIEGEIEKRKSAGKSVVLSGVAAVGIALSASGCTAFETTGDVEPLQGSVLNPDTTMVEKTQGEDGQSNGDSTKCENMGAKEGEKDDEVQELAGDVPDNL